MNLTKFVSWGNREIFARFSLLADRSRPPLNILSRPFKVKIFNNSTRNQRNSRGNRWALICLWILTIWLLCVINCDAVDGRIVGQWRHLLPPPPPISLWPPFNFHVVNRNRINYRSRFSIYRSNGTRRSFISIVVYDLLKWYWMIGSGPAAAILSIKWGLPRRCCSSLPLIYLHLAIVALLLALAAFYFGAWPEPELIWVASATAARSVQAPPPAPAPAPAPFPAHYGPYSPVYQADGNRLRRPTNNGDRNDIFVCRRFLCLPVGSGVAILQSMFHINRWFVLFFFVVGYFAVYWQFGCSSTQQSAGNCVGHASHPRKWNPIPFSFSIEKIWAFISIRTFPFQHKRHTHTHEYSIHC